MSAQPLRHRFIRLAQHALDELLAAAMPAAKAAISHLHKSWAFDL
jgi:hypothetical protein